MKNQLQKLSIAVLFLISAKTTVTAQAVANFENLTLTTGTYWDGASSPLGTTFTSADAIFPNFYETAWGGYWASGWAYSNMTDSTTAGYTNMYSARTASGYNSANYAIGKDGAIINLNANAINGVVNGLYITNTTYAALSMKNGDSFARKFGDTTGTYCGCPQGSYPDWFKLSITGFRSGTVITDTVNFYLADYRFANSTQDYMVKNWQWVNLTSLGNVDSLIFTLSSSDNGMYGMNTPAFFAIDNLTTASIATGIAQLNDGVIKIYPNPAGENLTIDLSSNPSSLNNVTIYDYTGKVIESKIVNSSITNWDLNNYSAGIYFVKVVNNTKVFSSKIVKK